MEPKPVEKFDSHGGLYYACPHEGCAWTFQVAVNLARSGPETLPSQYVEQLHQNFAAHLRESHSGL